MILDKAEEEIARLRAMLLEEKATVVIPSHNEAATLGAVIDGAKKSRFVGEVIVVDDGSHDGTLSVARLHGAKVIRHRKNMGKGRAIMSGAEAARTSALVFIDADLESPTQEIVERLAMPVLLKETRFCKSTFDRDAGRVTELVAKPLLEFLYPEARFSQPLSGQFAIRKELLLSLDVDLGWGIDISVLLSALRKGERIIEVNIGEIRHKHRDLQSLAMTAREVTKSILQNAGFLAKRHKLLVFDFDGTLVRKSSIFTICESLGLSGGLAAHRKSYFEGKIGERELTRAIAQMLRGTRVSDFIEAASRVKPAPYANQTMGYLRRMGYRTAVISFGFRRAITSVFPSASFDAIVSPTLHAKRGRLTGGASIPSFESSEYVFSKGLAIRHVMKKIGVSMEETIAIGNAESDNEMFQQAGISLSINTRKRIGNALRLQSLPELLVIAN